MLRYTLFLWIRKLISTGLYFYPSCPEETGIRTFPSSRRYCSSFDLECNRQSHYLSMIASALIFSVLAFRTCRISWVSSRLSLIVFGGARTPYQGFYVLAPEPSFSSVDKREHVLSKLLVVYRSVTVHWRLTSLVPLRDLPLPPNIRTSTLTDK